MDVRNARRGMAACDANNMADISPALPPTQKEVLLEIIEKLREMPHLYDRGDKNYTNKARRDEGYKVLLEIYKKIDRYATMKTLKKKIDNLRTTYFRELKKVKVSMQNGAETDDIYVPTLWYFDALSFIGSPREHYSQPVDVQESSSSGEENQNLGMEISWKKQKNSLILKQESSFEKPNQESSLSSSEENENLGTLSKKRKNPLTLKQESLLDKVYQVKTSEEDSYDVLGKSIIHQLRDLNRKQFIITRKLISDVLYYAALDRLTEESSIVLE